MSDRTDELVQCVTLHNSRKLLFNGYILLWIFAVIVNYGFYSEINYVGVAVCGVITLFVCLCCQWSIHIHTFLNCSSVSIFPFYFSKCITISLARILVIYNFRKMTHIKQVLQKLHQSQIMAAPN